MIEGCRREIQVCRGRTRAPRSGTYRMRTRRDSTGAGDFRKDRNTSPVECAQRCPCDGWMEWRSPYGVSTIVYRAGEHPWVLMSNFGQDRYANPSGPTQWAEEFGLNGSRCNHVVFIWFTIP